MTWTAPMTAVDGDLLTAQGWNTNIRDNLVETAPAKVTQAGQYVTAVERGRVAARQVGAAQAMSAETVNGLGGHWISIPSGPSVELETGSTALVTVQSLAANNTDNRAAIACFRVSGATTMDFPDFTWWAYTDGLPANNFITVSKTVMVTKLNPGNNTFTVVYQCASGTKSTFENRQIIVMPL